MINVPVATNVSVSNIASVQRGQVSLTIANTTIISQEVVITSVNTAKSFVHITWERLPTVGDTAPVFATVYFSSSSSLMIIASSSAINAGVLLHWEVVTYV